MLFVLAALVNALALPAYQVAIPGTAALAALRLPLGNRPFLTLVLTLSGCCILQVQLLLPVLVTHATGTPPAVASMYGMDALLAVLLLYPMARWRFNFAARRPGGLRALDSPFFMQRRPAGFPRFRAWGTDSHIIRD